MKKQLRNILLTTMIVCGVNPLYASSGHDHAHTGHGHSHVSISKAEVQDIAKKQLARLVYDEKIDSSWAGTDTLDTRKKQFKYSTEWMIRFENINIKDKTKQIIYIFVNLSGKVTGANYTGK